MKFKIHQFDTVTINAKQKIFSLSNIICPVCNLGDRSDVKIYDFGTYSVVKCSFCTTMHLYPIPDEKSLALIYNNNYYKDKSQQHGYYDYASGETFISKTYKRRLKFIEKIIGDKAIKNSKFHEIGCALGIGLLEINNFFNTKATGSDVSLDAKKECENKGIVFYQSDSYSIHMIDERKDIVFIFDVIEHLVDIPRFVDFLSEFIVNEGYLIITTPNMKDIFNIILGSKSPSIKIPQHIVYFDTNTLVKALQNSFDLIAYKKDFQYISVARLIERFFYTFGINLRIFKKISWGVLIPNGMGLYIFKRKKCLI